MLYHVGCCRLSPFRVCSRRTGLRYQERGLQSAPNRTRRGYGVSRDKSDKLKNLGAGTNTTQIARAACSSDDIMDQECTDVLLLALMPASYSSNNTRDTPGRLPYISPAQVSNMHLYDGFTFVLPAGYSCKTLSCRRWPC